MSTQTETVIVCLREMIMRGEFSAGEKLGEAQLAEKLNVSRTPVRLALTELANEGLLQYRTNRGFEVTSFSIDWITDAVAVREQLEGLAARRVATAGLTAAQDKALMSCILQVDGLLQKPGLDHRDVRIWSEINGLFHRTIVEASRNATLLELYGRFDTIPLASANSFASTYSNLDRQHAIIQKSQAEHKWIYDAIRARDVGRAEALMKQHVLEGQLNMRSALERLQKEGRTDLQPILKLLIG